MNFFNRCAILLLFGAAGFASPSFPQLPHEHKTQRIIFVMTDGLHRQEVFNGADLPMMNKKNGKLTDVAEPGRDKSLVMEYRWTDRFPGLTFPCQSRGR